MTPRAAVIEHPSLTAMGWLRIVFRLAMMAALLATCVPLYYLWRVAGWRNPWPRRFLAGVARAAGVSVRVEGAPTLRPGLLLANHVSWIDVPAIAAATGAAFVAHDGLAASPALRWLCAMNDTVFIARHDRTSVAHQVLSVRDALLDTGALAIFPEGTTGDGDSLLPFKSSLLSAFEGTPDNVAVRPVLLDYGAESAAIAWIGDESGLNNFKRILARRKPVRLTVHLLPALEGDALTNRKTMAAAARDAMERQLIDLRESA